MQLEYECDPSDLLASPWAPFPIFDATEDRWHVLFVSYMCDATWMVSAGGGNIFGARSTHPGRAGIEGPFETYGIVIGPNASDDEKRWGSADHQSSKYVDAIAPFMLRNGSYAAFVGEDHYLAIAMAASGPWQVSNSHRVAISTPSSAYNENPVVTELDRPDGTRIFVAVFDTVQSESQGFGMSWSEDGLHWHPGVDVPLPRGCRTPLGLIDEGDGLASLLFTRRFADCHNQTALPGNGADAISPASCANVYAATFAVGWHMGETVSGSRSSQDVRSSSHRKHVNKALAGRRLNERERRLQLRLNQLDAEKAEVERLLRQARSESGSDSLLL